MTKHYLKIGLCNLRISATIFPDQLIIPIINCEMKDMLVISKLKNLKKKLKVLSMCHIYVIFCQHT